MTTFVLDASVSVKWFLSPQYEPLSAQAQALYSRFLLKEIEFIIPELFWAEVGSAFWKAVRLGRFQNASAQQAIITLLQCNLRPVSNAILLEKAFDIANMFGRTVHDSIYLALAEESGCELVTADERLVNALAARYPLKWLGAI